MARSPLRLLGLVALLCFAGIVTSSTTEIQFYSGASGSVTQYGAPTIGYGPIFIIGSTNANLSVPILYCSTECVVAATIPPPPGTSYFGEYLAISGSLIAVGDSNAGMVSVYSYTVSGTSVAFSPYATLHLGPQYGGIPVALDGTLLVVGKSSTNVYNVYDCSSPSCSSVTSLSVSGDDITNAVSISNGLLSAIFQTPGSCCAPPIPGVPSAYFFSCSTAGCSSLAGSNVEDGSFVVSVSSNGLVAIGNSESAVVSIYQCTNACSSLYQISSPAAASGYDGFGSSVSFDGSSLAVGAVYGSGGGNAYLFTCTSTGCVQNGGSFAGQEAGATIFGTEISLTGSLVAVSDNGYPTSGYNGAVTIFSYGLSPPPTTHCPAAVYDHATYQATPVGTVGYGSCFHGYSSPGPQASRPCLAGNIWSAKVSNRCIRTLSFFSFPFILCS